MRRVQDSSHAGTGVDTYRPFAARHAGPKPVLAFSDKDYFAKHPTAPTGFKGYKPPMTFGNVPVDTSTSGAQTQILREKGAEHAKRVLSDDLAAIVAARRARVKAGQKGAKLEELDRLNAELLNAILRARGHVTILAPKEDSKWAAFVSGVNADNVLDQSKNLPALDTTLVLGGSPLDTPGAPGGSRVQVGAPPMATMAEAIENIKNGTTPILKTGDVGLIQKLVTYDPVAGDGEIVVYAVDVLSGSKLPLTAYVKANPKAAKTNGLFLKNMKPGDVYPRTFAKLKIKYSDGSLFASRSPEGKAASDAFRVALGNP